MVERHSNPVYLWEEVHGAVHPNARELMTDEFYWSEVDDGSPFGNDTGADTLADYVRWRSANPVVSPMEFVSHLLSEWGLIDDYWDVTDEAEVENIMEEDPLGCRPRDEVAIAVAFAQLALEGRVDEQLRIRTLNVIKRQLLPCWLEAWKPDYAPIWKTRLLKMQRVLLNPRVSG